MKIAVPIVLSFIVIVTLFTCNVLVMTTYSLPYEGGSKTPGDVADVSALIRRYHFNLKVATTSIRGYLLTREYGFLSVFDSAIVDNRNILATLGDHFASGSEEWIFINDIKEIQEYYITDYVKPLLASSSATDASAAHLRNFDAHNSKPSLSNVERDVVESIRAKFQSIYSSHVTAFNKESKAKSGGILIVEKKTSLLVGTTILSSILILWLAWHLSSKAKFVLKLAKTVSEGSSNFTMSRSRSDEFSQISNSIVDIGFLLKSYATKIEEQKIERDQLTHILLHEVKFPICHVQNIIRATQLNLVTGLNETIESQIEVIKTKIFRIEEVVTAMTTYGITGIGKPGHIIR